MLALLRSHALTAVVPRAMRGPALSCLVRRSARIATKAGTDSSPGKTDPSSSSRSKGSSNSVRGKQTSKKLGLTSNVIKEPERAQDSAASTGALTAVPSVKREESLWKLGHKIVCGVDEAGRGPLAGPVVAAACVIRHGRDFKGLKDSKKLSESQRERLYEELVSCPDVSYALEMVQPEKIDEVNILQATLLAMSGCVKKLGPGGEGLVLDYVLFDGNILPDGLPASCSAEAVVKGDSSCRVIAAAAILAKVTRDRLMLSYDREFPEYGFKDHKGYGTPKHMQALLKHGPSPIHRRSFAPIKDWKDLQAKGQKS